jgi:hypothetical protein
VQKYGHNWNDLYNVIEDWRRIRDRTVSPPQRFPTRDITPIGRSGFHALAGPLRKVRWPAKFKAGHIDQYDGSNNPEKFIQVYQTVIEAVGGDDRVKANFLHTTLSGVARSWLINLPDGSIHSWDQQCAMFIRNFQGTYERPSTAETLKTIKQRHDKVSVIMSSTSTMPEMVSCTSRTLRLLMSSMITSAMLKLWKR